MAAAQIFGAELAWVADPAPGPAAVLAHQLPHVDNLGDLHAIPWEEVPPVDILTAGFPCQPVSLAGPRRGTDDPRWLFHDILDGVRRLPERPALLIFENVRGLLTANRGAAMRDVVHGLAELGLLARWRVLRASDCGAPHQRARVWITAADPVRLRRRLGPHRRGAPGPGPVRDPHTPGAEHHRPGREGRVDPALWGRFLPAVRRWERTLGRPAPFPAEIGPRGYPRISARWLEWMMGVPDGWVTDVPGLSATAQRHLLGNGVVPQQARAAIADLMDWPDP
jgi:DNA (cytosine-5)-methyltransferase 1